MGKKSPDKPRDYTPEKAAFAESELAKRQSQADSYNTAVNSYNTGLSDLSSQLDGIGTQINNLGIVDDERFDEFDNMLANYSKQANTLQSGLGKYSTEPDWSSTVMSPYGAVDVGMPQLGSINTSMKTGFSSQLGELNTLIDSLRDRRRSEEDRIDNFSNEFSSNLSGIGSSVGNYDIEDLAAIESTQSQLARMRADLSGFDSDILSEYRTGDIDNYLGQIDALGGEISSILDRRSQEEDRISGFEQGLNTTFDDLNSRFGDLDISNLSELEEIQRMIDQSQLSANRFDSALSTSFGDELSAYNDLESRLGSMMSRRDAELARVQSAEEQANSGINSILGQLGSADIYSGGMLNQIENAISQGRNDINGFSSLLNSDFGSVLAGLDDAQSQLDNLRSSRTNQLSGFGTQADQLLAEINGYDLTNENGLNQGLSEAQSLMSRLSQYSGTDTLDYRNQLQSVIDSASGRLGDLRSERGNIESDLQSLLSGARTQTFNDDAAIDALVAQLDPLRDRQSNYRASQATDEIDQITGLINSERARLQADRDAIAAQEEEERQAFLNQGFGGLVGQYGLNRGGYGDMFSMQRRLADVLPTSFSRQLAVQYA